MKRFLLIFLPLALLYINSASAQQLPLYSQYIMNDFFINPAIAGSKSYSPLVLSVHKQWVGIENSPATQTLSYHTMLPNKTTGLGGILFNDTFGPEGHLGLQFIYSYHFYLDRHNKISLGLAAVAMQYKMDQRYFNLTEYNDPSITYQIERTIVPDANFGVYFYGEKYYVSISAMHLFGSKLKINKNLKENRMARHYFVMGGYKFLFASDMWEFEPSIMLKGTFVTLPQIDINTKFTYNSNFWFGFSLRPKDAFIANIGFKYKQYYLGYAYDFTFSDLSRHTFGSQEIILGFNINEKQGRKKSSSFF